MASSFEYAIVRVVPRVEREEFINAGVLVYCLAEGYLDARIELDVSRLKALCPQADVELIRSHLEAFPIICAGGEGAGPIGRLSQRERWHWLVAPRSTLVQLSPVHAGLCQSPSEVLEKLLARVVRLPSGQPLLRVVFFWALAAGLSRASLEVLRSYVFEGRHLHALRRRREWFDPLDSPSLVLWWTLPARPPSLEVALRKLDHLRVIGPTQEAFMFGRPIPAPVAGALDPGHQ